MSLSISIDIRSSSLCSRILARARQLSAWIGKQMPYELPNYQRSREELGGVPWRRFEKTDAWFVGSAAVLGENDGRLASVEALLPQAGALDSVPELRSIGLTKRAWMIIAGAGLVSLLTVLCVGHFTSTPKAIAVIAPAPAAVAAPVVAPVRAERRVAPQAGVQSLFSAKKPARAGKRHAVKARRVGA